MEGSESGPEEQRGPALYSYEPAKLAEGMPAGGMPCGHRHRTNELCAGVGVQHLLP